jgi:hypothetical protein
MPTGRSNTNVMIGNRPIYDAILIKVVSLSKFNLELLTVAMAMLRYKLASAASQCTNGKECK